MAVPTVAWSEATPAGTDDIRDGDNRIRELKTQIREIITVDHKMASSASGATWGYHEQVTLIEAADIGSGATGVPILGAQTVTAPELCYTDEADNDVILTDAGKIALQNGRLPNDSYLIGRNQADDGNINILKVNTSDGITFGVVATLVAASLLSTSAAPTTDAMISNKKYVDDRETSILAAMTLADIFDYGTSASAYTERAQNVMIAASGTYTFSGDGNQAITNLPFTSATSYVVMATFVSTTTVAWDAVVTQNSGAQFTLYNNNGAITCRWFAWGY